MTGDQAMSNTMNYRSYTASMVFDTDDKIIVGGRNVSMTLRHLAS